MERVVGKKAVFSVDERGSEYAIDITRISPLLRQAGVYFSNGYLNRVIGKYYEDKS